MPKNPLEEASVAIEKEAAATNERHLEMWRTWKSSDQDPEHLEPLLRAYQPFIRRKAQEFGKGLAMVPASALEAEVTKHVIGAFETFNPNAGAQLTTHVHNRAQKALRFVIKHQNIASIPEAKSFRIGDIGRAEGFLQAELGRAPSNAEIAEHIRGLGKKMTETQVGQIRKAIVKDVPGSTFESDPLGRVSSRQREVLSLLPQILSPEEKAVFDLVYHPTSPVTSTGDIARRLGKSEPQVSRLKSAIIEKVKRYE